MKHKKLLIVFSIFFVLLCSLTAISASDLNDTDVIANDDVGDEIVSSDADIEKDITTETDSGNTFKDLNSIVADGGNIVLTRDYEYNESDFYPYQRGVRTPSDTIIDGSGHYISGKNENRIFYISNVNNVTLKNIRFVSGYSGNYADAGALYIEDSSNITIINCSFENNNAKRYNGHGGAIYAISTDPLTIIDSKFEGNSAQDGGAISTHGNTRLILENTSFINNLGYIVGGALNGDHSTQIINNCLFQSNDNYYEPGYSRRGGAIFEDVDGDNEIVITNTKFKENYSPDHGGAVYINGQAKVLIEDSEFSKNKADAGGAIVSDIANVTIRNTEFNENEAESGGAIMAVSSTIIEDCNFTANHADKGNGGAIYVFESNDNVTIKNCNFAGNSADYYGGAIFNALMVTVLNCNFTSNKASNGGAIVSQDDSVALINNSNFIGNIADENGAIHISGGAEVWIDNSNFINNNATKGGAIFSSMAGILIENSHFIENNAENGGAIYEVLGGRIIVNNSDFSKNTASRYGGAIVVNGSDLNTEITLENTIFAQNTDTEGTGDIALADEKSNATLINVTPSNLVPKFIVEMQVEEIGDINYTQPINLKAFNIKKFGQLLNNGSVVFSINGINLTSVSVQNGTATLPIFLGAGSYKVDVTYVGGAKDANPTKSIEFNVLKLPAVLEVISVTNCTYGGSIQIIANVTSQGLAVNEGKVIIIVNGKEYSADVDTGIATIEAYGIDAGTYSVNLTYDGNYSADNVSVKFEVSKCSATIEIVNIANCTYGNSIQIKVNVTAGGSPVNEGNVSAVVNGKAYSAELINGTATIDIADLSVGTYEANVTFVGNYIAENVSAKFEVSLSNAVITAKDIAYVINYGGKYSAVIKDSNGNAVVGEKVTFTLNGKDIGSAVTDKDGVAAIQLTPAILKAAKAGNKNMVIKLVSSNYNPVSKTVKVTINKEKTKILKAKKTYKFKKSKKAKNIKVTLKNSKNKVMKKVKVTIKLSGKKIKGKKIVTAKTNKKGVVTFKLGKKLTKKTKVKYTITYKGNAYYNKVVKKGKINVK